MAPWKLPLVVTAIAVPIVVAFYFGGGGLGLAMGALAAATLVVVAVRQRPRGTIGETVPSDRRRLLLVISQPVEDADTIRAIVSEVRGSTPAAAVAEVRVLSPVRVGFLDRWASDLERAQREAQQRLVMTVASLAKAGIVAEARVGDEDLVQAVEDQLQTYPASEVILVTGGAEEDPRGEAAAAELRSRLRAEFRRLFVSGPAAR